MMNQMSHMSAVSSDIALFVNEMSRSKSWNPLESHDWDSETISPHTFLRVKRDLGALYSDPIPGVFVVPEDDDITKLHALITGTFDTPYEGGFFYFVIRCPPDYPIRPPRIKLMTTCNESVRFNPNIYKNGKVCLSILGTWAGPSWSPALTLSSVLLSIQSLLNDKPYHNEPGFGKNERDVNPQDVLRYNEIIIHETIRVAVCDMLEDVSNDSKNCPIALKKAMEKSFIEYYQHYEDVVMKKQWMTNQSMNDPFGEDRGTFDFHTLLQRLRTLKEKFNVPDEVHSDLDPESDLE